MNNKDKNETKRISKFLSLILRHSPQTIGIRLDEQGWANVNELLEKSAKVRRMHISREKLDHVVATNDKKRFAFNEDGTQIRASQGHSLGIQLGYEAVEPPETLFHGTVEKFIPAIREGGLKKMSRDHVHLSKDLDTANIVGNRRGKALILTVRAGEMHAKGYAFYISENGVWLTDAVPPEFIDFH